MKYLNNEIREVRHLGSSLYGILYMTDNGEEHIAIVSPLLRSLNISSIVATDSDFKKRRHKYKSVIIAFMNDDRRYIRLKNNEKTVEEFIDYIKYPLKVWAKTIAVLKCIDDGNVNNVKDLIDTLIYNEIITSNIDVLKNVMSRRMINKVKYIRYLYNKAEQK